MNQITTTQHAGVGKEATQVPPSGSLFAGPGLRIEYSPERPVSLAEHT